MEDCTDPLLVLEVLDPVDVVSGPADPVPEEEVTPVAGDPAKELPGAFLELAPHPIRATTITKSSAVLPADAVCRRSGKTMAEIANRKTPTAASNKIKLTHHLIENVGKLAGNSVHANGHAKWHHC